MSAVRQDAAQRVQHHGRLAVWQPGQPVFWLFLVLLVCSAALTSIELVASVTAPQSALAALLLVTVQAVLFVLIVRAMPRFPRQPASLRVAALLWGMTVVPAVAILANTAASDAIEALGLGSFSASLSAPINEDLLRLLGVLLVLSLAQFRRLTVMDGAVYGFLVGAGFELVENLLYSLRGDDFGATISVGVTRLFVGFGLHALWTTLAGAALAYCLSRRQCGQPARWWVLVPAVVTPMLLHAGWDTPEFSIFAVLKFALLGLLYGLSIACFFFAVRWGRRSEFAWYSQTQDDPASLIEFRRLPRSERRRRIAAAVGSERRA